MGSRSCAAALVILAACRIPDTIFIKSMDDASGDAPAPIDGPVDGPVEPIDAASPRLRSCDNLPSNCGAGGTGYCCDSSIVLGGWFLRDFDVAQDGHSGSRNYPATISDFRLDKYEVTVGRFRAFVAAGMGTQSSAPMPGAGAHPHLAGSGWDSTFKPQLEANTAALIAAIKCSTDQTWTDAPAGNENRPMNCITWYEAMAFCIWDGGYLPTEAEWNYAAAGGDQQRAFAWSVPPGLTTITDARASYSPDGGTNCNGDGLPGCGPTDLIPVGTKPQGDGRWGQSDLTGNVDEWNLDWIGQYPVPCTDCATLAQPVAPNPLYRITRGGSFVYPADHLRTDYRDVSSPTSRNYINGVRCARAP